MGTPMGYGEIEMLDVTKFAVLSVVSIFVSNVGSITFPLRSGQQGNRMGTVDSDGKRVKLVCVNWYGAHMEDMVVNGLDRQPIQFIADKIAELGFNCVRLPCPTPSSSPPWTACRPTWPRLATTSQLPTGWAS